MGEAIRGRAVIPPWNLVDLPRSRLTLYMSIYAGHWATLLNSYTHLKLGGREGGGRKGGFVFRFLRSLIWKNVGGGPMLGWPSVPAH